METEKEKIIQELNELGQALSRTIDQIARGVWIDLNLTIGQLKSLIFIDFEGSTCVKDLARALKMAPPNATKLVDSLVKEGLVSREENPDDRRLLLLKTTSKGKTLIANLRESAIKQMSDLLTQFSLDELRSLAKGLSPFIKLAGSQKGKTDVNNKVVVP